MTGQATQLGFERFAEPAVGSWLGARRYRPSEPDGQAAPRILALGGGLASVTGDMAAGCIDAWRAREPARAAMLGCVDYAVAGDWLHGTARIDEANDVAGTTQRLYRDIFSVLDHEAGFRLARVWNYLARINATATGDVAHEDTEAAAAAVERYRLFNLGRQRAFIAARRDPFEGAPAACALGTERGPLTVHFLATRRTVRPVENPRQVSAYRYPSAYGPRSPTFSRAVRVDLDGGQEGLFISGTASIVGHETRHIGDVRRQTAETLANLAALVEAAAAGGAGHRLDTLDITVYVRDPSDLDTVRATLVDKLGGSHTVERALYLRADICRRDLLVEIEGFGSSTMSKHEGATDVAGRTQ